MAGVWIIAIITATCLKGKFSGLTGDSYGAINEVAEVSVLILALIMARLGLAWPALI
jgi:cobalamin synthase